LGLILTSGHGHAYGAAKNEIPDFHILFSFDLGAKIQIIIENGK
jgi:hypothetical protein